MKMTTGRIGLLVISACLVMLLAACGSDAETKETPGGAGIRQESEKQGSDQQEMSDKSELADEQVPEVTADMNETAQDNETASGSNVLVVYFSRTGEQYEVGVIDKGNTAIVADMIIEATGADSFEILPADVVYPATYDELTDVAKQEQRDNARPAIAGELPDLSKYDTIFIGAPVWWGDWPMICYTYFEANDFSGKMLIPFSTHGGSGLSGFDKKLSKAADGATIGTGLASRGAEEGRR